MSARLQIHCSPERLRSFNHFLEVLALAALIVIRNAEQGNALMEDHLLGFGHYDVC